MKKDPYTEINKGNMFNNIKTNICDNIVPIKNPFPNLNRLNIFNNFPLHIEINQMIQNNEEEEDEKDDEIEEINENEKNMILNKKIIKYKCSFDDHSNSDAINFCVECKIYMCNKCVKTHDLLFKKHNLLYLNNNKEDIFIDICQEVNHCMKLEYYCRTHNQLCCAACISKIKSKGNGKHKNCKVFGLLKIKDKKKNLLEENMNKLNELSNKLEPSIDELKKIYEIINDKKEKLKVKIQKLFTEIRNALNEREDKLLLDVDKKFDEYFFNEEFIRKSEKLPKLVKISLEKGKINEKEWEDENALNKLINNCINIENNIKDINVLYSKIDSYITKKDLVFELVFKKKNIKKLFSIIKSFGRIKIDENDVIQNEINIEQINEIINNQNNNNMNMIKGNVFIQNQYNNKNDNNQKKSINQKNK